MPSTLFEVTTPTGGDDELFGSVRPESLGDLSPKRKRDSISIDESLNPKTRTTQPNFYPNTIKLFQSMGYMVWRCDRTRIHMGHTWTEDLLGLFDLEGIKGGEHLGIQVTTKNQVLTHIQKYSKRSNTVGQAKTPIIDNLFEYLDHGGKFVIVGWDQPGGVGTKWVSCLTWVTREMIEKAQERSAKIMASKKLSRRAG